MNKFPDDFLNTYPDQQNIYECSKERVLKLLDELKLTVEGMNDFERFPEGTSGALVYALLLQQREICPDQGDFNYLRQALHVIVDAAFEHIDPIKF